MKSTVWNIRAYSVRTGNLIVERFGANAEFLAAYIRGGSDLSIIATPQRRIGRWGFAGVVREIPADATEDMIRVMRSAAMLLMPERS